MRHCPQPKNLSIATPVAAAAGCNRTEHLLHPPDPMANPPDKRRSSIADRKQRTQPVILNRMSMQSRPKPNLTVTAMVQSASSAALSNLNGLSSLVDPKQSTPAVPAQIYPGPTTLSLEMEPLKGLQGPLHRHIVLHTRQSCPPNQKHSLLAQTMIGLNQSEFVVDYNQCLLPSVAELKPDAEKKSLLEEKLAEIRITVGEEKSGKTADAATNHLQACNYGAGSGICRLTSGGSSLNLDDDEVSLMYSRYEKIPMKDFTAEIRASVDVENFLNHTQLLLDLHETGLEQIMDSLLHHLLDQCEHPSAFAEAKKLLYTHDNVHQLAKTIQGTCRSYGGTCDYDQSWLCVLCMVPSVQRRSVAIARLRHPANLGRSSQEVRFVVLIITPTKEKGTKNALETGRTFSTLFADTDLRLRLLAVRTESEFKKLLLEHMKELAEEHAGSKETNTTKELAIDMEELSDGFALHKEDVRSCWLARGLRADLKRRLPFYLSDYKDGLCGDGTLHKTVSTTVFLYFACILPAIALGVLNFDNTGGYIDVKKVICSQTIGGIFFAICGGQPMVILLTTAPLALYTKVIFNICEDWELDFPAMFAWTGLWNSFFLLVFAVTDASRLMKWSTRSTEEIFSLFMAITFTSDAFRDVLHDFRKNYFSAACTKTSSFISSAEITTQTRSVNDVTTTLSDVKEGTRRNLSLSVTSAVTELQTMINGSASTSLSAFLANESLGQSRSDREARHQNECLRENSLLYLLLMLGTLWLSVSLYNFTKTPFLNSNKRALLADCALPVSVLAMSMLGSFVFKDIKLERFQVIKGQIFIPAKLDDLPWPAVMGSMFLGLFLSLLFFMDQSIAGAMVNSPENRLKKGPAYHWDLMVVALLNAALAFLGLPMVHGALPHSPLHVRAMADVEDHVDQGHVYQRIMFVRETRVTGIVCHVLIGLSILSIDKLKLIPRPVLDGLFLYLAITALHRNQLFERIVLLFTEQAAYPPNHYIRTVPQRKIHLFTASQLVQLAVLCGFGFAPMPYLKMVFPVLLLLLLPVRHKLVPFLVEKKFLLSLDSQQ